MSHDIIVKQHGGSIDVETEPGLFTEFKIVLPRRSKGNPHSISPIEGVYFAATTRTRRLAMAPIGAQSLPFSARADVFNRDHLLRNAAWERLHENIMVAVTVAIGAFVFRPRQLIGYDRLRSQPA